MSKARRRQRKGAGGTKGGRTSTSGKRERRGPRPRGEVRDPSTPAGRGRGGGRTRALIVVGLVVTAIATWWLVRARDDRTAAVAPASALPVAALLDSQRAAIAAKQWARSVYWAGRLTSAEPNDPMRMLGLGLAWHNWAWAGSPYDRARTATRSSLERVRMEKRAFALLDSAHAFARDNDQAARMHHWVGQIYEIYGLPVDAAQGYEHALEYDPNFALTLPRARWVVDRLRDPLGGGQGDGGTP